MASTKYAMLEHVLNHRRAVKYSSAPEVL